jgi:type II secretory pathway component PulJ
MKRRTGMGLVEVVIAMAVATAMVGLLAATVSRMMLASEQSHEHLRTMVTLGRLGEQFRRDVHAAGSATIADAQGDQPGRLVLEGSGRQVAYAVEFDAIERVATATGEAPRRERFALGGLKFLGWKVDDERREVSVALAPLARRGTQSGETRGQFPLSALLARPAQAAGNESGDNP